MQRSGEIQAEIRLKCWINDPLNAAWSAAGITERIGRDRVTALFQERAGWLRSGLRIDLGIELPANPRFGARLLLCAVTVTSASAAGRARRVHAAVRAMRFESFPHGALDGELRPGEISGSPK